MKPYDYFLHADMLRGAWVKHKQSDSESFMIVGVHGWGVDVGLLEQITYHQLLRDYTFLDGKPCGYEQ